MFRRDVVKSAAAVLCLAACSPPAQQSETHPPRAPAPIVITCNALTPDTARAVLVQEELASTAAASDLRGGAITPGVYDLTQATRIGAATGWSGAQTVALEVTENEASGVTFNWASVTAQGEIDRWTAAFTETPSPRIIYSCGRIGEVPIEFAARNRTLNLRIQDGANGQLALVFERRV
ncbi:MAG: hypothetical protein JNM59_01745 [Hyphomonadaceae bacterium]|nr:hypothetical protein [Hyphomonadaceae bacterium]